MAPKLIIEQKITAFVNQYRVYHAEADGSKGELVAFVQQKRAAFKEKVTFYRDEQKTEEVFRFRAEKTLDLHGRYYVEDPAGQPIGVFRKAFKKSLFASTWHILDGDTAAITLTEHNKTLAIARRVAGFLPVVSDIAEAIIAFIKYHFAIIDEASKQVVGMHRKTKRFRDHYELSVTDSAYQTQDWRVWAAVSVALDALQDR